MPAPIHGVGPLVLSDSRGAFSIGPFSIDESHLHAELNAILAPGVALECAERPFRHSPNSVPAEVEVAIWLSNPEVSLFEVRGGENRTHHGFTKSRFQIAASLPAAGRFDRLRVHVDTGGSQRSVEIIDRFVDAARGQLARFGRST
jgi:hypothetical protein